MNLCLQGITFSLHIFYVCFKIFAVDFFFSLKYLWILYVNKPLYIFGLET